VRLRPDVEIEQRGLLSVDRQWSPENLSSQFCAEAGTYHDRYFARTVWGERVVRAVDLTRIDVTEVHDVLDIGSGSGNTVLAALDLFPSARVAATDHSIALLQILEGLLSDEPPRTKERVSLFCFDLHKPFFASNAFDLAIGSSVLHHVLEPKVVLTNVVESLRTGGHLLLFEPLESGCHVLAALFQAILDRAPENPVPLQFEKLLRGMKNDLDHRFGVDVPKPWTRFLDDKWLFTVEYIRREAEELGCTLVGVAPWQTSPHLYTDYLRELLRASGNERLELPEHVWGLVSRFDRMVDPTLHCDLAPEAIFAIRKA
jgi:SAM-dependent methyltransferase